MYVLRLACRSVADATNATLQRCLKRLASRNNSIQEFTRLRRARKRVLLWPVAAAMAAAASLAGAQTAFTDVTESSGVAHFSETYGASWGDVNGDGFPDLFVSNHRTMKSLFQNKGNGTFVDVASKISTWANRPSADTHGASWADFNNDGTQDLLVSVGTGNPSEWFVNQNGKLTFETNGSGLDVDNLGGRMPVWLDYDNDQRLDVLLAQYGGVAKLFHQNKGGTFTELSSSAKLLCIRFHYAQLVDVNGDGRLDVLCPDEADLSAEDLRHLEFPVEKNIRQCQAGCIPAGRPTRRGLGDRGFQQ